MERTADVVPNEEGARRILLVEDNESDRYLVERLLRAQPRAYTFRAAATGKEGLEICRRERIDCVLLDFYLPDMTGVQFVTELNHDPSAPGAPCVIVTGAEDDSIAGLTLKSGAEDYLVKDGLSARALARGIENAIERFRIRHELETNRAALEMQNRRLEILRDELQAKVAELADATRAKDRFLAVMSHEMRTPLNAILGYADLLDMGIEGPLGEPQRQYIERMRVGSRHLLDLINDVLDLTRADARKLELDMRAVDLGAVVEEVAALLDSQAIERQITLVTEIAPDLPPVFADLQRLRQVITNLVGNAIKFTDEGSVRVRCFIAPNDRMVTVEVVDTGIGIEPDVLPLVFNEFYQARDGLTRRHGGSGLGLAISRRLANLMGGDLNVKSQIGTGSTFMLRLQAAEPGSALRPEDVEAHREQMAARATELERVRSQAVSVIAFGENETALTELQRRVTPNVRLRWTTDVTAVAPLAREERAALVVLDVGSAGGAAWRAATELQNLPDLSSTAVLLLPSLTEAIPDETPSVLDLGWVSLVPKPFTAQQLTYAVNAAAGHGQTNDPNERPRYEVLVVDDDADSRRVAGRFLADANVTVHEAPDGESALLAMRMRAPDVVVLDLMMPVLDGFGVLAAMRADPLLANIPTVVLTAKSLSEAERQFLSRTAVRVLQKGEHRLADVAALVLRAAARTRQSRS